MRPRLLTAAATVPLAVAALAGGSTAAVASRPTQEVTLTPLGTYSTGAFDEGASEITAYDPGTHRVFVVNAQAGTVDVLDISDPTTPERVGRLDTPGVNSVAVHGGLVAVAEQAGERTDPGTVSFFDAESAAVLGRVTVGALPDMVTFTPNGDFALVANEGEPEGYCAGDVDPEGSVSVVDLRRGVSAATVRTAGFTAFDADDLRSQGVRVYGPGATAAQDLEPEYVTVSRNSRTAWVSLQEANALAKVDIRSATVTDVVPLGLKDHARRANSLDPSDRDGGIRIGRWPVKGLYQPDAIASYAVRGKEYVVTANEGDTRDYECFSEEARVSSLTLDPVAFPDAEALTADSALGRLTVSTTSPEGPNGRTQLHVPGARSVSVRDAAGALVWDSGDALERLVAAREPAIFNANNDATGSFDTRSDNTGPEPEGLDLGRLRGRTYAFVGLERVSAIAVLDLTDPKAGR
ncbi:MAG TPA: choice-of-anchor I family protein, partial [Ornithinibacter sp.]|nr:choice-of-anchor I family protein [Ornithinibacter sp.]